MPAASTTAPLAVPAEAGVISADIHVLATGLDRFLAEWDDLMAALCP